MVEILLKNKEIIKVNSVDEIPIDAMDFYAIQFVDYTDKDISWAGQHFGINCSPMRHYEDIEISSHFLTKNNQTAFHISIPHYCFKEKGKFIESPIFFVMSDSSLFFFSTFAVEGFFNRKYSHKFSKLQEVTDIRNILMYHMEFVSDYIQFNFDRLDNLRENIKNKIDLEQNHIFKVLTVITLCLSLPMLIGGIYGMNFINMPELNFRYGYPIVLLVMVLSTILPYLYFKKKKWL